MSSPETPVGAKPVVPVTAGASIAGAAAAVDPDVLFWASWGGLLLAVGLGLFAAREIPAYLGPGRTLSEVTEATIAARPLLGFVLLAALGVLGAGFGVLLPLHWYTGVL